ncbi:MAG: PEP/pyruvate-binding domain-containing protein [bacterium]|jgi:hypothetical protein|nr:PEP/pyruvate-binding domain-containing protein [bacterium]
MIFPDSSFSTGLSGLDEVLHNLLSGDNIVWQVDSVADYQAFVEPFHQNASKQGIPVTYFRFANHQKLLTEENGVQVHYLSPEEGFEQFLTKIHSVIQQNGEGGCYVFDSLSELSQDLYSDQMIANFFMLTCPFLHKLHTVAYFAVLRNFHSQYAAVPIMETTQLLLDVYRYNGQLYVHPLKVTDRYSPTMYLLHAWEQDQFRPITSSCQIAEILNSVPWFGQEAATFQMGVWNRVFLHAEEIHENVKSCKCSKEEADSIRRKLLKMAFTRDPTMLKLLEQYLDLEEILTIRKRMIGTGYIGGKTVGMVLARAILQKTDPKWASLLESHDSFYISSEVFYTYLVRNDCWWIRKQQKDPATYRNHIEAAQQRILSGHFPDYIVRRFERMLDYYGQSPIVVRSSSLLEDSFGNTFAGKYQSVFLVNQGTRAHRLTQFIQAVKTVYASCMSETALSYRAARGLLDQDEQMALLVQRVSGNQYGAFFYPQIAGVGYSINPYPWNHNIDSQAGVLRLVFGLGTRAVERFDDDYTRIVALNSPSLRPETSQDEIRRYTQRKVETLNLELNSRQTVSFPDLLHQSPNLPSSLFYEQEDALSHLARGLASNEPIPVALSFQQIFKHSTCLQEIRSLLKTLEAAYHHAVDIEFTVNFHNLDHYKINLLQCRPIHFLDNTTHIPLPKKLQEEECVLRAKGAVIGQSRSTRVDRIIYVVPSLYGNTPITDRYSIARLIGRINQGKEETPPESIMLIGPGRWGTTTPSLGIPVSFAEINRASILCEIVAMREDFIPDVSLGTHFFNDIVETNMLYLALFPDQPGNWIQNEFFESAPNRLLDLQPSVQRFAEIVRVIDIPSDASLQFHLYADTLEQFSACYRIETQRPG